MRKIFYFCGVMMLLLITLFPGSFLSEEQKATSVELGFSSLSPTGSAGGFSLPASCESNYAHDSADCVVSLSASPNPVATGTPATLYWSFTQQGPASGGGIGYGTMYSPYDCYAYSIPAGWSSARTYRTTSGTFITPNLPSPVTYQVVCRAVQDDVYYTGYNSAAPYSYDYVSAPYVVGTRAGSMCSCNSGANSCGLRNQGLIPCGSTQACSAPVPDDASCTIPTVGVGGSTGIPGGTPTGSLPGVGTTDSGTLGRIPGSVDSTATAGPPAISQTVGKGGQCVVTFDATPATACMVTAPGFSRLYGPNGTFVSPRMGVDTSGSVTYILSCYNGKSVKASVTKKIVCTLNPNFLEVLDR